MSLLFLLNKVYIIFYLSRVSKDLLLTVNDVNHYHHGDEYNDCNDNEVFLKPQKQKIQQLKEKKPSVSINTIAHPYHFN